MNLRDLTGIMMLRDYVMTEVYECQIKHKTYNGIQRL